MAFADLLATADEQIRDRLGGSITYTPTVGAAVTVDGVFDAAHRTVEGAGESAVNSVGPAVFLTQSDLPSDPETDTTATVTVSAVTYSIREVHPDGLGGVYLLLTRT